MPTTNNLTAANTSPAGHHPPPLRKVLLLGSGGLAIGQAGEFDYSGTQAVKSLLEEGLEVIVVNPNIATVQTNPRPNVRVYLYPITPEWVSKIIASERPDGIIGGFGGQTALNCLIALHDLGVLERYGVRNLGTPVATLKATEDRDLFAAKMQALQLPVPASFACTTVDACLEAAASLGYPVIIRAAYALGGLGSGFAHHATELQNLAAEALTTAPQLLVEKSLKGWKELEYEIMRDSFGNAITICNMENFDALGVHTGDSIVAAPSQSLTDDEYQCLRKASLAMVEALGIIGECNAQFALCPRTSAYYVIEVNARLSRSSALASKASGYPIAHIAAKVVLGKSLVTLQNPVTGSTSAFYEPALDYVTVKIPRWDLGKFAGVSHALGSTMKSVGEVMAIGRSFPEALQKATRMISEWAVGLSAPVCASLPLAELEKILAEPTDRRLYAVTEALRRGLSLERINALSDIDCWFLAQLRVIVLAEQQLCERVRRAASSAATDTEAQLQAAFAGLEAATWREWKALGFGDEQLAYLAYQTLGGSTGIRTQAVQRFSLQLRRWRESLGVLPVVKKIDTTSGEYPSPSNYFYLSFVGAFHDDIPADTRPGVLVLGAGAYRIGTSVEFDWCAVSCSETLQKSGYKSILINCNPETVSTDYNCSDRLYFEELTLERILDIAAFEAASEVIACMGGQLPNKLAAVLADAGLQLLGHSATAIDTAEDRSKFSALLDQLGIAQPQWVASTSPEAVRLFIAKVGFPVLIRPSYVLSGAAMRVAYNAASLEAFLSQAEVISQDYPVVVSEFLSGAREIELDGVAKEGEIVTCIVSEHIENAGIHSGDATTVVPAQKLYVETVRQVKRAGRLIAKGLNLHGPFNIQFLARHNRIKVIECNARAARSFPFISKVIGLNLAEVATSVLCGHTPQLSRYIEDELPFVGVKAAMFSFTRLKGADPQAGVEMAATGEVGCIGPNFEEALLLALEASHIRAPSRGVLISAGPEKDKVRFLPAAELLRKLGIPLYATAGTAKFLQLHGFKVSCLAWPRPEGGDVLQAIRDGVVDLVINCPKNLREAELSRGSLIRQTAAQCGCPLLTNMEKIIAFVRALYNRSTQKQPAELLALPPFRQA